MAPSTFGRGLQTAVAVLLSGVFSLGAYFFVFKRKTNGTEISNGEPSSKEGTKKTSTPPTSIVKAQSTGDSQSKPENGTSQREVREESEPQPKVNDPKMADSKLEMSKPQNKTPLDLEEFKGAEMPAMEEKAKAKDVIESELVEPKPFEHSQSTGSESEVTKSQPQEAQSIPKETHPNQDETQSQPDETEPQPKEKQTQSDEARPKPEETPPKLEEIQSQSEETQSQPKEKQAQPDEAQIQPEETQSQPGETHAQPKKEQAQPEETQSQPKEKQAQPEEAQIQPGETHSQLEEAQIQPEEKQAQPEEAPIQPEKTHSQSEEAQIQPEEKQAQPEEAQIQPGETHSQLEEAQIQPEEEQAQPEEAPIQPEKTHSQSEEAQIQPEETHSQPEDAQPNLELTNSQPGETQPQLEVTKCQSEETKPQSEETKPQSEETEPQPEEVLSQPDPVSLTEPSDGTMDKAKVSDTDCKEEPDNSIFNSEIIEKVTTEVSKSSSLTPSQAEVLVSFLSTTDEVQLQKVLVTIANASAFTHNQDALREAGCPSHLSRLLSVQALSLSVHPSISNPELLSSLITATNNLALNANNQPLLQDCIQPLIDFASCEKTPEVVLLGSLQALTNLSVTPTYHAPYTKMVQSLYEQVDKGAVLVRLQAIKLLVNLSCNPDMVSHLLAAKAPGCLLDCLSPDTDEAILIRWTTLIANVVTTVQEHNISSATLPAQHKAPSPETMFTALYGLNNSKLKSKVFVLSKHTSEDVRAQATRIHACFS